MESEIIAKSENKALFLRENILLFADRQKKKGMRVYVKKKE
jgi:hypothetical protein